MKDQRHIDIEEEQSVEVVRVTKAAEGVSIAEEHVEVDTENKQREKLDGKVLVVSSE